MNVSWVLLPTQIILCPESQRREAVTKDHVAKIWVKKLRGQGSTRIFKPLGAAASIVQKECSRHPQSKQHQQHLHLWEPTLPQRTHPPPPKREERKMVQKL